jgi:hypothetical protein
VIRGLVVGTGRVVGSLLLHPSSSSLSSTSSSTQSLSSSDSTSQVDGGQVLVREGRRRNTVSDIYYNLNPLLLILSSPHSSLRYTLHYIAITSSVMTNYNALYVLCVVTADINVRILCVGAYGCAVSAYG